MLFIYIKDGNIIKKSEERMGEFPCDMILETSFSLSDKIIYENGNIIKYEDSHQKKIDRGEIGLKEENIKLRKDLIKERKQNEFLMTDYMKLSTQIALNRSKAKND